MTDSSIDRYDSDFDRTTSDSDSTGASKYASDADSRPSDPIATRPVQEAENGSMVQDFDDLKRLGRDMERVKTGSELSEEGLVSDPIQEKA